MGARLLGPPLGAAAALAFTTVRLSGRTLPRSSEAVAFTPQVAAATLLGAGWAASRRRPATATTLGGCGVLLAAAVAPRTRRTTPPDLGRDAVPLCVLSANGLKGEADPAGLVAMVREVRPDVLALQEQDAGFIRRLDRAGLAELLPHRVLASGTRVSDAALLSPHPFRAILTSLPPELVAAEVELPGGRRVPCISIHPLPPVGPIRTPAWAASLSAIPSPTDALAGGIVAGDFNATLDHPQLRAVLRRGWRDAASALGRGLRATWISRTGIARLTIDHVLVAPGTAVDAYRVHEIVGSDHRAIEVRLRLPA